MWTYPEDTIPPTRECTFFSIHTEHVPKIDQMLGHSISLKNLKGSKSHEVIFEYNRIRNE